LELKGLTVQQYTHLDAALGLLEAISSQGSVGFAFLDSDLKFVRVNERIAEMNGRSAAAHMGVTAEEVLGPERWPSRRDLVEGALHGKAAVDVVFSRSPDAISGIERHMLVSYYPVWVAEAVVGVTVFVRDITEQVVVEKKLRESEARLSEAQRVAHIGSWESTSAGLTWSEEMFHLFGYDPNQPVPDRDLVLAKIHPDDLTAYDHTVHRAWRGEPYGVDIRIVSDGGAIRWFHITGKPTRDAGGAVVRLIGTAQDVTERKIAEDSLRQSERRYRSLVDATSQIVWTNTAAGEMRGDNRQWSAFTGQTQEEVQGLGWANAIHPDDIQPTIIAWTNAVTAVAPFVFEHRLRRYDGVYRTFAIRAVAVQEEDGTVREWVGAHTDITEHRELELARQTLLTQQQRLLGDMLSSVTEGKLILCDSAQRLPAYLEIIKSSTVLTREMGLSELRRGVREAARQAKHSEERIIDLVTAVSEAGMNAIVHGGGYGTALVSVSAAGVVQVRVQDTGSGIPVEDLPRAALSRGYSTKATLGHGLKMMLETIDRLYLLTGNSGTTVVLEQEIERPLPAWLAE